MSHGLNSFQPVATQSFSSRISQNGITSLNEFRCIGLCERGPKVLRHSLHEFWTCLGNYEGCSSPWRSVKSVFPLAGLRHRPAMRSNKTACGTCRIQNLDIPLGRRDGAHGGLAGRGRAGLDANITVRPGNKPPPHPPKHRRHVSSSPQKHEQAKSYVNRWRNKTRG